MTKRLDLTGKTFGYWKVLELDEEATRRTSGTKWKCLCTNCNKTYRTVGGSTLYTGKTTNCGCVYYNDRVNANRRAIIGNVYGNWEVVGIAYPPKANEEVAYTAKCLKCGELKTVTRFRLEHRLEEVMCHKCGTKRGESRWGGATKKFKKEYSSWSAMLNRCYRVKDIGYSHYGGRGITVCDEWRNDFFKFLEDMGPRIEGTTLDRIDVDLPYSPSNCRWADIYVQANNRTDNAYETINGITMTRNNWYAVGNKHYNTIKYRMEKHGQTFAEAMLKDNTVQFGAVRVPI